MKGRKDQAGFVVSNPPSDKTILTLGGEEVVETRCQCRKLRKRPVRALAVKYARTKKILAQQIS